jgi:membrane fusion protein, heavy metal efflux system
MSKIFGWLFTAILFMAIGGFGVWTYAERHQPKQEAEKESPEGGEHGEKEGGEKATSKPSVAHTESGEAEITFPADFQARMGVQIKPLQATTRPAEIVAYGVLQDDPARTFILRAPIPGTIANRSHWPHIGEELAAGTAVGQIQPRLGPVERADLASRLATAQAEVDEQHASLEAARTSYESKKKLNEQQPIVSERALEEAAAKYKVEEAKLRAAEQTVRVLESSLTATSGPAGPMELTVDRGGRVVQVLAQPGESVEAGTVLLQVADYENLLARVDLFVGQTASPELKKARVVVTGLEDHPLDAERVGLAASVNSQLAGAAMLFRVAAGPLRLQPGMGITAYLQMAGPEVKGVIVPRSATVRLAGKAWVYVQDEPDKFVRRELIDPQVVPEGLLVVKGFEGGAKVVVQGAQSLLTEEMSAMGAGGAEE